MYMYVYTYICSFVHAYINTVAWSVQDQSCRQVCQYCTFSDFQAPSHERHYPYAATNQNTVLLVVQTKIFKILRMQKKE